MKRMIFLFLASGVLAVFSVFAQGESITLTTYYPSPSGIYRELRSERLAIGQNYHDPTEHPWSADGIPVAGEISQDASLVVEGRTGIGTLNPAVSLHVDRQAQAMPAGWDGTIALFDDSELNLGTWSRSIALAKEGNRHLRMGIHGSGSGGGQDFDRFYISTDQNSATPWDDSDFVIAANSFVGLGTVNPQAKLHIRQDDGAPAGSAALFDSNNWGNQEISLAQNNNPHLRMGIWGTDGNLESFYLSLDQSSPTPWDDGHFIITSNHDVGIGRTNPQARLDVEGGVKVGADLGTCTPPRHGTLRFHNDQIQYCSSSGWETAFEPPDFNCYCIQVRC